MPEDGGIAGLEEALMCGKDQDKKAGKGIGKAKANNRCHAAYSIKKEKVANAWESAIVHYLQPYGMHERRIDIKIRNDNDSRPAAKEVQKYLSENGLM